MVCGFDDVSAFDATVESSLRVVRAVFDAVFTQPDEGEEEGCERLLDWPVGAQVAIEELENAGFSEASQAHRTLHEWAGGDMMTTGARERLRQLVPRLSTSLSATPDPDQGLLQLVQVVTAYGAPGAFVEILHSRPGFMSMMLTI